MSDEIKCGWCDKPQSEATKMVAGLRGVICDQCVRLAMAIITEDEPAPKPNGCAGAGNCHGGLAWCDLCGDVDDVCDDRENCDRHRRCVECNGFEDRDLDGCTCCDENCTRCTGEYCDQHYLDPCECDVVERHTMTT